MKGLSAASINARLYLKLILLSTTPKAKEKMLRTVPKAYNCPFETYIIDDVSVETDDDLIHYY